MFYAIIFINMFTFFLFYHFQRRKDDIIHAKYVVLRTTHTKISHLLMALALSHTIIGKRVEVYVFLFNKRITARLYK